MLRTLTPLSSSTSVHSSNLHRLVKGWAFQTDPLPNAQTVLEAAAVCKRPLQEQGILDDDTANEVTVEIVTRTVYKVPRGALAQLDAQPRKRPEDAGPEGSAPVITETPSLWRP